MKCTNLFSANLFFISVFFIACNNSGSSQPKDSKMKEETVTYNLGNLTMKGFVVYNDNTNQKRPGILVVPEWWGLNDYDKMRARELAKLGYIAMAVDMYGDGKVADNPTDAGKLAAPFYSNLQMAKDRLDAAVAELKTFSQTDPDKMAAIGYCFGGGVVLNAARLGEDLKGVVSFHGNLIGAPANKDLLKAKILVCHGLDDQFVKKEDVDKFRHQMDSIGADYIFKAYPGATHAFTNPEATALGKKFNLPIAYNAAADTASWNEMKAFFKKIFK